MNNSIGTLLGGRMGLSICLLACTILGTWVEIVPAEETQSPLCNCEWERYLGQPGTESDVDTWDETVEAVAMFDGAVYIGGAYWDMGPTQFPDVPGFQNQAYHGSVSRWDGRGWRSLGRGLDRWEGDIGEIPAYVRDMAVHDDGSGAALFVAGAFDWAFQEFPINPPENPTAVFSPGVVKWTGTEWVAVGRGLAGHVQFVDVRDIAVFGRPGLEKQLYAVGWIRTVAGAPGDTIVRWDGTQWAGLGGAFETQFGTQIFLGQPQEMIVFNDGSGKKLYVAGRFDYAPGRVPARNIACWDGVSWSAVGAGLQMDTPSVHESVYSLTIHDDGVTGPSLYAGGLFNESNGTHVSNIARWDGAQWTPLGAGVTAALDANGFGGVLAMTSARISGEPVLCVGGQIEEAGGVRVGNLAAWRNGEWSDLGGDITFGQPSPLFTAPHVTALSVAPIGADIVGPGFPSRHVLLVGGVFDTVLSPSGNDGESFVDVTAHSIAALVCPGLKPR